MKKEFLVIIEKGEEGVTDGMWSGSPRLRGVHEHLERVRLFFGLAQKETDSAD